MVKKKKLFLQSSSLQATFLLKTFFAKHIYTKFIVIAAAMEKKKKILLLDNYLNTFIVKIKKKFKRLQHFYTLKYGNSFKGDLFIYKHSKLSFFFFLSIGFKVYLKKSIKKSLHLFMDCTKNIIFLYKNIRGGFLGFSSSLCGYISKQQLLNSKNSIQKYKNYGILHNFSILPYFLTKSKTFYFFNTGFLRKYRKGNLLLKRFFFKRFKIIFALISLFPKIAITNLFLALDQQISLLQSLERYFKNIFFTLYQLHRS